VAVITGSANGMGKAMALRFAHEGCDIAVVDLNFDLAQKVAEEIKSHGRQAVAIKADISKSNEIKSMIEQSIKAFGKIDILVNNAGAAGGGNLEKTAIRNTHLHFVYGSGASQCFSACLSFGKSGYHRTHQKSCV